MNLLAFLGSAAGAGAGEAAGKILGSFGGLAKDIRTAITGVSPEIKGQLEIIAAQIEAHGSTLQGELNKLEAASDSFFKSGWRPSVGWICASALAWHYIVRDYTFYFIQMLAPTGTPLPPRLDVTDLIALLVAMLGFGGARTLEKIGSRRPA